MLKCFESTAKLKVISVPEFPRVGRNAGALFCHAVKGGGSSQ